eukprot:2448996-Ditylum_brightwellii.AAC.2
MREPLPAIDIIGMGSISKPSEIGTIVFTITDCKGTLHELVLENLLPIPEAPKNSISITKWLEDRNDNCGIITRGTYFTLIWEKDEFQKLVPHP